MKHWVLVLLLLASPAVAQNWQMPGARAGKLWHPYLAPGIYVDPDGSRLVIGDQRHGGHQPGLRACRTAGDKYCVPSLLYIVQGDVGAATQSGQASLVLETNSGSTTI